MWFKRKELASELNEVTCLNHWSNLNAVKKGTKQSEGTQNITIDYLFCHNLILGANDEIYHKYVFNFLFSVTSVKNRFKIHTL